MKKGLYKAFSERRIAGIKYLCICMACLLFKGCIPEGIVLPARVKSIATSDVTGITADGATLSGKVVTNDADTVTCGVIYGVSSSLHSTSGTKQTTTSNGDYSIAVTGLDAQTTYYYRAYAIDAGHYKYGEVRSFETKPSIAVVTSETLDVTASTATLRGTVSNAEEALTCGIIYGTSTTLSSTNGIVRSTTSSGDFSISVTGLDANTTYYYRAYVLDAGEYKYGEILSFKTKYVAVTTGSATEITDCGATLSGTVSNAEQSLACGIIYGTSTTLSSTSGTMKPATSSGEFSVSVTGLNENTTYYYRAYVVDAGEYKYGDVLSFTTKKSVTVATGGATNITASGATLAGTISNAEQSLTCGIIYGTSSSLSSTSGTMKSITSSGVYSVGLTGLSENTTYYYRAYVVDADTYKYGDVKSFTTKNLTVTTGDATNITTSGATLSGMIGNAGEPLTCGIIYGTFSTLSSTLGTMKSTTSSGEFSIDITELKEGTRYYYCAYIVDEGEYKYGDVLSFTTKKSVTVTTGDATNVTASGATLSGTVNNTETSLTCGIIYGASSTLSSTSGTMKATTSQGDYSIGLTGLVSNTTYYYRAYVIDDGTYKYGEVLSFKTAGVIVTTGDATNITYFGATLSGTVSNVSEPITYGFSFGTSSSLGAFTLGVTTSSGNFSESISGLLANTTYYYRAFISDNDGERYGDIKSFTTGEVTTSITLGDAVDLGLSVKWASCNVGAESPEDYGGYYAWGETKEKVYYDWSTYKWCNGSGDSMTKYCIDSSYGTVDNKTTLDPEDDVAHVLLGDGWRMPTFNEIKELMDNCSWNWITRDEVNGYKVTGPNGNSIFLPAAGRRHDAEADGHGSNGYYWSGTLGGGSYSDSAWHMDFSWGMRGYAMNNYYRDFGRRDGHTVRPVKAY